MHISWFRNSEASARAIDTVVNTLEDAEGIVINVRHNCGGEDRAGPTIASRFVDEPRPCMSVAMRKLGQLLPAFAKPVAWQLEPLGPKQYTGPIVLLVNSRSISVAENFAVAMRAAPHALIMGEMTAGVMAGTLTSQPFGSGWEVSVPVNQFRNANGISWEGVGITPYLRVKNDRADIEAGSDRVLETALDFLRVGAVQPWDRAEQKPTTQLPSE